MTHEVKTFQHENSLAINIPQELVERYDLRIGQTITMDDELNDGIVLMIFNKEF